ncbi:MAG TPA: GNAT family N-acetyltransferase [Longimicrobiaceae bacterium]|nr:GNAT family N-acetyltransferase [Longimicrobiaceae bacterium]
MSNIRQATATDADELARLLTLLGHPTTAEHVRATWDVWAAEGNEALVAEGAAGGLSGAVTLHRMRVLHRTKPVGRVTALIVDEAERGGGIGRALMAAAERTLEADGCGLIEITSNLRLTKAHAFYRRLGYEHTSIRLAKPVVPAS